MSTADRPAEVVAPGTWDAIDFISDLHLGADTPRTFEAWARYLRETSAEAVVILGDLFEAWIGDDSRTASFEAQASEVLREAAGRRWIGFMVGNRDFLVGHEMLDACGVVALADPTVFNAFGERVLLTHGDALCLGDTAYQQFRAVVRNPAWQQGFLARPLEERRDLARALRTESEQSKTGRWHDIDGDAAVAAMTEAVAPTLVHGHTHRPASESMAPGRVRHVLSDWDLDHDVPGRAEVMRWTATGFTRLTPAAAERRPIPTP